MLEKKAKNLVENLGPQQHSLDMRAMSGKKKNKEWSKTERRKRKKSPEGKAQKGVAGEIARHLKESLKIGGGVKVKRKAITGKTKT